MFLKNSKIQVQVNNKLNKNLEITDITLNLDKSDLIEEVLEDINQFPKLTSIKLYCSENNNILQLDLSKIDKLKQIKFLELTGFNNILNTEILKNCKQLTKLYGCFKTIQNYDFIKDLYSNLIHEKAKLKIRIKAAKENKETIDFFNLNHEKGIYLNIETTEDTQIALHNLLKLDSISSLLKYNRENLMIEIIEKKYVELKTEIINMLKELQVENKMILEMENYAYSYEEYARIENDMQTIAGEVKLTWDETLKARYIYERVLRQEIPIYINYLKTYYILAKKIGLQCEIINSQYILENNGYYAYQQLNLNEKWYNLDIAWDRERILQGQNIKYFLNSDKEFIKDLDIYTRKQHLPIDIEKTHIAYEHINEEDLRKIEKELGISRKSKMSLWIEKWKKKIEKILPMKEKRLQLTASNRSGVFTK